MNIWESGRESSLLDHIIAGRKTIEGRLDRDKFSHYRVGDIINIRRDIRNTQGELCDGETNAAQVEIIAIRNYPDFREMVKAEGYEHVIPDAVSYEEAAQEYDRYYSAEDQANHGVLAIEVRVIK